MAGRAYAGLARRLVLRALSTGAAGDQGSRLGRPASVLGAQVEGAARGRVVVEGELADEIDR